MEQLDGGLLALASLVLLAIIGAYLDVRYRRLPNWLCLLVAGGGLVATATLGAPAWPWSGPVHGVVALIVGMLLFAGGLIGGGDAKFYAALALWFPLRDAPLLIGITSVAGLVVLLAWLAWRRVGRVRGAALGSDFHKLPYGVAIASGAVVLGLVRFGG